MFPDGELRRDEKESRLARPINSSCCFSAFKISTYFCSSSVRSFTRHTYTTQHDATGYCYVYSKVNTTEHTHTHTQPFNGRWSGTTRVGGRYQKKHSSTHTHPDHRTSFINFLHLPRSIASSVFSLRAWQSSFTTFLQVLFGLPLGLGPSTSYSLHFFHLTPQNRQ